ncbi:MAG: response regulator [Candidatus Dormibacteria bacterium]
MTRVVIADDHGLVRSGMRRILEAGGILVVGEAANGEEAIDLASRLKPDVILVDLHMPGRPGIDCIRPLLEATPGARVLVVTAHNDVGYLRAAFDAGASGFVTKESADDELLAAVHTVAQGGDYVHPSMGAALARNARESRAGHLAGPGGALSEREVEVVRELALGETNAEVAARLFLSIRTVENHRAHIFQKLGVSTRAELVKRAIDAGLLG